MLHFRWSLVAFGLLAAVSIGCGGGPKLYPVSGTVTYEDKPVEGATVMFIPQGGAPSMAVTDASGKYTLATRGAPGAPAGAYNVTISKSSVGAAEAQTAVVETPPVGGEQPSPEEIKKFQEQQENLGAQMLAASKEQGQPKDLLPARYAIPEGSGLNATVTADASKNVFDFPLTP